MTGSTRAISARVALVLAFLLAIPLIGTGARAGVPARIAIKPSIGPPTMPFNVRGTSFGGSETVDIYFDAALVGKAATSPIGSFTKRVKVPETATPGNHTVTATGETTGFTAFATFLVRTNWARFHFDNANTGYNPFENVLSTSNVGTLVQKWAVPTSGGHAPDPIVAYGRVYVAPTDGVVRALDATTGDLLWSFDTGGAMSGAAPTAANDMVYVGNKEGGVFALSAATGLPRWLGDVDAPIRFSPTVGGGAVYVAADTALWALDAMSGNLKWQEPGVGGANFSTPTLAYSEVFVATAAADCRFDARDALTGALLWERSSCLTETGVTSRTLAADGGLVFDFSLSVHAIDAVSGVEQWYTFPGGSGTGTPPVVGGGAIYAKTFSFPNDHVIALDESTGDVLWDITTTGDADSAPALANGVLYTGYGNGRLYALEAATGNVLWSSELAATAFQAAPAVSDGMVFAATADGTVYAFGLP